MYPNQPLPGQLTNPALGGALAPLPPRYPPVMIKTVNNNPITTMASPFFVDNLLQHQKAVNFQSQFVNSQIHSYIQEQHHQFLMHQNHVRHQQALKYAAAINPHENFQNNEKLRKNSLDRLSGFSPMRNSRNESPISEEASPRIDFEDEEENLNESNNPERRRKINKEGVSFEEDSKTIDNCKRKIEDCDSGKTVNCDVIVSKTVDTRNLNYIRDDRDIREDNSRSADEDRYTEESPVGSPVNARASSSIKNEFQLSPSSFNNRGFYGNNYQQNNKYCDEKEENIDHVDETIAQERKSFGKDEFAEDNEGNANNDSDPDTANRNDRETRMRSVCSNCGSFECNPFYPSCRSSYGLSGMGVRRFDGLERRFISEDRHINSEMFGSPIRNDVGSDDRLVKDRDGHLVTAADVMKRCGTSLEAVQAGGQPKPILKFSVNAILGNDHGIGVDRNTGSGAAKMGHHDGYSSSGAVFALPGFPLPQIAKPIASRPPAFPPHLHSLLAHCRQHPYLTVGGAGPGFLPPSGVGGGAFPWAGGARGKPRRGMMRRAVFSDTQRRGLERRFQLQKYISKPDRKKLAEKLGLKDSQVKIWFQNRRMKWRNSKERELLASGGSREQTLPNKNNPHPDLSDAEADRTKLSPASPGMSEDGGRTQNSAPNNNNLETMNSHGDGRNYLLAAADDAVDFDSETGSGSDEEINVT